MKRIYIHPSIYLLCIISFLTGTFMHFVTLMIIVIWHELGHYLMAIYYKWDIDHVTFSVFGGVLQVSNPFHANLKEWSIVTIAGPMQHLLIYGLYLFNLFPTPLNEKILLYNTVILCFNLLPIYPLDGGALLAILLQKYIPFKLADQFIIMLSLFSIAILLMMMYSYHVLSFHFILIVSFLIFELYVKWRHHPYTFILFLMSRLHQDAKISQKNKKYMTAKQSERLFDLFTRWRRDTQYMIRLEHVILTEKICLRYYFKSKDTSMTCQQLLQTLNYKIT